MQFGLLLSMSWREGRKAGAIKRLISMYFSKQGSTKATVSSKRTLDLGKLAKASSSPAPEEEWKGFPSYTLSCTRKLQNSERYPAQCWEGLTLPIHPHTIIRDLIPQGFKASTILGWLARPIESMSHRQEKCIKLCYTRGLVQTTRQRQTRNYCDLGMAVRQVCFLPRPTLFSTTLPYATRPLWRLAIFGLRLHLNRHLGDGGEKLNLACNPGSIRDVAFEPGHHLRLLSHY